MDASSWWYGFKMDSDSKFPSAEIEAITFRSKHQKCSTKRTQTNKPYKTPSPNFLVLHSFQVSLIVPLRIFFWLAGVYRLTQKISFASAGVHSTHRNREIDME